MARASAVGLDALENLEALERLEKLEALAPPRKTSPPRNRAPLVGASIEGSATPSEKGSVTPSRKGSVTLDKLHLLEFSAKIVDGLSYFLGRCRRSIAVTVEIV